MRVQQWTVIAALVLGVPAIAAAQTGATDTTDTTTTTTIQTQTQTTTDDMDAFGTIPSHWTASGFIGSDFGDQVDGAHVGFGGSVGYLWRGAIGGEFLAGFSPNFELADNILADEPQINSYMGNVMAAVPLGLDGQWQPFVSAGLGRITLNSDFLAGDADDNDFEEALDSDASEFGGNIGFGVMGFAGNVGVRADVRYFRAFEDDDPLSDDQDPVGAAILTGLDFWRTNIGVAFRW